MSVLIVVAHPDDEVLGCGGTAAALAAKGVQVRACVLSGEAGARRNRPKGAGLAHDTNRAQEILGLQPPVLGGFANMRLNTVAHIRLVEFVESAIEQCGADMIFTHHPGDLNDDHFHTARSCEAAARLFQRKSGVPRLNALYYMEIPSATDWSFTSQKQFVADTFCPVKDTLEVKIAALNAYRGVMREFPHPRSEQIVRALAAYRGGQAGMEYAEAFQTGFHVLGLDTYLDA